MAAHHGGDFIDSDCSNEEEWEEQLDETYISPTSKCIFCDKEFKSADLIFIHCKNEHSFDIHKIKKKFALDCFGYIRLINFIRLKKPTINEINAATSLELWEDEKFMQPALTEDLLLTFDIESCESENEENEENDEDVILSRSEHNDLIKRIKSTETKALDTQDQLNIALTNVDKLKVLAQRYFLTEENIEDQKCVLAEDQSYFTGYSHFGIHHEMLQDQVRTEGYRDAILKNENTFKNKIILDVGCGTGILSLFSIKAGAAKCYAVDQSDIIYHAMDIVKENQLEDKIVMLKNRMEAIELEVDKVDIIISEWMGYFLFFECMFDTIIYARDKYLSPNGHILPNRCTLNIAGIDDTKKHDEIVGFWNDVYGFKMSCMKKEAIKEASIECVDANTIVTSISTIADVDIRTCSTDALEFSSSFSLIVEKTSKIVALVSYFDVFFELDNPIFFSTSPSSKPTHWKQSMFYLEEPICKTQGDTILGNITCKRNEKDPRSLLIFLDMNGKKYQYAVQ
uniref:type I protein arginine methyltransferase n=1 Tax=Strigamia maritima TaxID=126957 RepID=T1IQ17_STRMM